MDILSPPVLECFTNFTQAIGVRFVSGTPCAQFLLDGITTSKRGERVIISL